jgi:hypothetical protein
MSKAFLIAVVFALAAGRASAAVAGAEGVEFFEKKVRPVLAARCYKCHSTGSEKLKGGLMLDSRPALLKGGDGGPAVVPGKPDESPLIQAVRYDYDDLQMPPKQKLPAAAIADLEKWVAMGAPWPNETAGAAAGGAAVLALTPSPKPQSARPIPPNYATLREKHWAWQPVRPVSAPAVKDAAWPADDVDRFVLAKLEAAGLKPAPPAEKRALIRRVTFDLVGLPPAPEEIEAFVNDDSAGAYEKLVDRLLASPQFGERWGRHWLDVARYGESTGLTRNFPYPYAWRYRDYVIDSFNHDKPYDRFLTEQIAGDQLPYDSPQQHNEQLVATGLLAIGIKDLNERNPVQFTMDAVDEQIDVVGRAILATTISCARCHDHKFDPIPTEDYYALAGIFRSTQVLAGYQGRRGGNNILEVGLLARLDPTGTGAAQARDEAAPKRDEAKAAEVTAQLEKTRSELRRLSDNLRAATEAGAGKNRRQLKLAAKANAPAENSAQQVQNIRRFRRLIAEKQSVLDQLQAELDSIDNRGGPLAVAVRDARNPADCPIYPRGEVDKPGEVVPRGLIGLFTPDGARPAAPIGPPQSGRLELARWLTDPSNPLTARVMVNRVWHHLFGQGLVRTADNFGTTGEAPSHPELLDHLAARFVRDGWSVKKLVRSLVLSRTYRQGSDYDPAAASVDPSDRLLWRMAPRRLEAEAIRDAILAVAGTLDARRPEGSLVATLQPQEVRGIEGALPRSPFAYTRSVYLPIVRNQVPSVLEVFDFAEPTMVTGSRDVTTVAPQALYLMNNPFVLEQSSKFAERLLAVDRLDDAGRVDLAYQHAFGRHATPAEQKRATDYLAAFAAEAPAARAVAAAARGTAAKGPRKRVAPAPPVANTPGADAWASFCQALLASAEFRYLN